MWISVESCRGVVSQESNNLSCFLIFYFNCDHLSSPPRNTCRCYNVVLYSWSLKRKELKSTFLGTLGCWTEGWFVRDPVTIWLKRRRSAAARGVKRVRRAKQRCLIFDLRALDKRPGKHAEQSSPTWTSRLDNHIHICVFQNPDPYFFDHFRSCFSSRSFCQPPLLLLLQTSWQCKGVFFA